MIRFHDTALRLGDRRVLDGFSLDVPAGHAVALIGRTGSGKSALLAAAAAALPLSGGEITVGGRSVSHEAAAVRRLVGYLPGRPAAWPPCRAGEFLELAAVSAGLVGKPLRLAVARALDLAGLRDRSAEPIDTLPEGSGRRLLVARALLHDPQVLLLDDPFTALDPVDRTATEELIHDAHLMGRTVLAAVDDADVPSCFTHLAVLAAGRLSASGPADVTASAAGRRLRFRVTCPGRANDAAHAMRSLAGDARATDFDHAEATIDPAVVPGSRLVAAAVAAGVPVEAAGFHPAWTAQLLD